MDPIVVIREYQPADLPTLRQITVDSFPEVALEHQFEKHLGQWNDRDWRARKADQIDADCAGNPGGCFVAVVSEQIAGYVTTAVDVVNSRGRIVNLAVTANARNLGLGRRLIEQAFAYFRSLDLKAAQIETLATNAIGQHLYPACGFEEIGRLIFYGKRL